MTDPISPILSEAAQNSRPSQHIVTDVNGTLEYMGAPNTELVQLLARRQADGARVTVVTGGGQGAGEVYTILQNAISAVEFAQFEFMPKPSAGDVLREPDGTPMQPDFVFDNDRVDYLQSQGEHIEVMSFGVFTPIRTQPDGSRGFSTYAEVEKDMQQNASGNPARQPGGPVPRP